MSKRSFFKVQSDRFVLKNDRFFFSKLKKKTKRKKIFRLFLITIYNLIGKVLYYIDNVTDLNTGLPAKDEISETTVRNEYFLFPQIPCSSKLFISLANHINKPIRHYYKAEDYI